MAIRITCPGCKTALTLDEDKRGKKVSCRNCEKVLSIPAGIAGKRKEEAAVQEERKSMASAKADPEEPDADDEDQKPAKKKKKRKKTQGSAALFIIGGVAVFVVLLAVAGVSAFFLTRRPPAGDGKPNPQAKLEDKDKKDKNDPGGDAGAPKKDKDKKDKADEKDKKDKDDGGIRIAPRIEDGSPTKKGGIYVISNVRGAVYRTERKAELHSLQLSFTQFCDEYKGANRTRENFLSYIKLDGPIYDAVKEGYYQVNVSARLASDNIIAFERDPDAAGHLCVRANGDMPYVPAAQLKKELGIP